MGWFSRKPKQKTVVRKDVHCPYCMGKIDPRDILFQVDKSDGKVDEVFSEFASRYQGYNESNQMQAHLGELISQTESDLNIDVQYDETAFPVALSWQRNGGEKRTATNRVCPHCHCYLPTDIEKMDSKRIVLL